MTNVSEGGLDSIAAMTANAALSGRPVLVGYDGSDSAALAVREAAALASALGAPLRVVWAVDEVSDQTYFAAWAQDDLSSSLQHRNEGIVERAHQHIVELTDDLTIDQSTIHPVAILGDPVTVLIEEATASDAAMIVVGNKRAQGLRRILGSVAGDVVAKAPCGVYVAKTT